MSKVDQNPVYIACLAPSLAYIRHMSVLNLLATSGVSPSRTNVKTVDCLVEAKKLVPVAKGPGLRGASLLNPGRRGARLGRDQQRRLERRVMSLSLSRHARHAEPSAVRQRRRRGRRPETAGALYVRWLALSRTRGYFGTGFFEPPCGLFG